MTACPDLGALYGDRYKLRREADGVTWWETPERERAWLVELPCVYGVVYPHGAGLLAAAITSRRMGHQVAALPALRSSRGDVERVVVFPVEAAGPVLDLLRPRRRRRLSPEERARLSSIGRGSRFAGAE